MNGILDAIARGFADLGIHPILGSMVLGGIVALVLFRRRGAALPRRGELSVAFGGRDAAASVSIDGQTTPIPPQTVARILELMAAQQKIAAVKLVRESTRLGLADAKAVVEAIAEAPTART